MNSHQFLGERFWSCARLLWISTAISILSMSGCNRPQSGDTEENQTQKDESKRKENLNQDNAAALNNSRLPKSDHDLSYLYFYHRNVRGVSDDSKQTVYLDVHDNDYSTQEFLNALLYREIPRQAFLIAARDELGIPTRDAALFEEIPWAPSPQSADWPLSLLTQVSPDGHANLLLIRRAPKNEILWTKDFSIAEGNPYLALSKVMEQYSRSEFPKVLQDQGYEGKPVDYNENGEITEEIQSLLESHNEFSQYAAIRSLHKQIRQQGESPDRLAALARAYAQLGNLCDFYFSQMSKVFLARALLYAERLVQKSGQTPTALYHRALVRTLAGLPDAALDDLNLIGNGDEPSWAVAVRSYCSGDIQTLQEAAASTDASDIILYLEIMAQRFRTNDNPRQELLKKFLIRQPNCVSVRVEISNVNSLGMKRSAMSSLEELPRIIARNLQAVPDLPVSITEKFTQDEPWDNQRVLDLSAALSGTDTDQQEPSLSLFGQMLNEMQFTLCWNAVHYLERWLSVPLDSFIEEIRPIIKDHRYGLVILSRNLNGVEHQTLVNTFWRSFDRSRLDAHDVNVVYWLDYGRSRNYDSVLSICASRWDDVIPDLYTELTGEKEISAEKALLEDMVKVSSQLVATKERQLIINADQLGEEILLWEEEYPNDSSMQRAIGLIYLNRGEFESAERCLKRALAVEPSYRAYQDLAAVYFKQGDQEKWLNALEGALGQPETGLGHARTRKIIADHYLEMGEPKKALPYAEAAATSGAAFALILAGNVNERLENWEEAENHVRANSLRYENQALEWYFWCVRTGKGNLAAAERFALEKIASLDDEESENWASSAGAVYLLTGQIEKAYDTLLSLARKNHEPYYAWHVVILATELHRPKVRDEMLNLIIAADKQSDSSILINTAIFAEHIQECIAGGKPGSIDLDMVDRHLAQSFEVIPTRMSYFISEYLRLNGRTEESIKYLHQAASSPKNLNWENWFAKQALRQMGEQIPSEREYEHIFALEDQPRPAMVARIRHDSPVTKAFFYGDQLVTAEKSNQVTVWGKDKDQWEPVRKIQGRFSNRDASKTSFTTLEKEKEPLIWWKLNESEPEFEYLPANMFNTAGVLLSEGMNSAIWVGRKYMSSTHPRSVVAQIRLEDGEPIWKTQIGDLIVNGLQISGDQSKVFLFGKEASGKGFIKVLSIADGSEIASKSIPNHPIRKLLSSDSNEYVATLSEHREIVVWKLDDLSLEARFWTPDANAGCLVDGNKYMIVGSYSGQIKVIDLETDRIVAICPGHENSVFDAEFDQQQRKLLTTSYDHTAKVWDFEQLLREYSIVDEQPVLVTDNSIGMSFTPIPSGEFMMGRRDHFEIPNGYRRRDHQFEGPRHRVKITKPFYISQFEVTVEQFRKFVESTKYVTVAEKAKSSNHLIAPESRWHKLAGVNWRSPGFEQADNHPVCHIAYLDAIAFCEWLSTKEGRTYRLPTEAEWEHACRGGKTTSWYSGNNWSDVRLYANVADQSVHRHYSAFETAARFDDGFAFSSPVGTFLPNAYGCYDMHGNVYEWCQDYFSDDYYKNSPEVDPQGPESGKHRVQRGGTFFDHVYDSRSSHRSQDAPDFPSTTYGFRPVLNLNQ